MLAGSILAVLIGIAGACGVTVHQTLIQRLWHHIPEELRQYGDFIRAGAFYPDAFYDCRGKSDAAEESHWPPFLAEGTLLVKEKEHAGLDSGPLRAFLVGVLSHQVSDVSWHSLGLKQGLLDEMTHREFNGSTDTAHTALDVGGDMIQLHRLMSSGKNYDWLSGRWDYPTKDIQTILARLKYDVSEISINYCMSRGRAALEGEKRIANIAYKRYAKQSPILFDELEEYFVGGIVDMDLQTQECLTCLISWFSDDAFNSSTAWNICQIFGGMMPGSDENAISHNTTQEYSLETPSLSLLRPGFWPFSKKTKSVTYDTILKGSPNSMFSRASVWFNGSWAVSAPAEGKVYVYDDQSLDLRFVLMGSIKGRGKFATRFGQALAVVRINMKDYLLVGSPGLSRVHIFDQEGQLSGSLFWPNATTVYGSSGLKLVGESMAVDQRYVYIGAPYADIECHTQSGAVYAVSFDAIDEAIKTGIHAVQSVPLIGANKYDRFGTTIAVSGLFLLVGSPGESRVYGFDRLTHKLLLTLDDEPGSGFGGYLLEGYENYIVIGAPKDSELGEQSGKVYIYENTRRYSIPGPLEYGWFGYGGVIRGTTLFVTAPHADSESGVLYNVSLASKTLNEMGLGPSPYSSAFGTHMSKNESAVMCSCPFFDNDGAAFLLR